MLRNCKTSSNSLDGTDRPIDPQILGPTEKAGSNGDFALNKRQIEEP